MNKTMLSQPMACRSEEEIVRSPVETLSVITSGLLQQIVVLHDNLRDVVATLYGGGFDPIKVQESSCLGDAIRSTVQVLRECGMLVNVIKEGL